MTTITGYSCLNKKKHVNQKGTIRYYCEKTGYEIEPLSCNKGCKDFESHTIKKIKK